MTQLNGASGVPVPKFSLGRICFTSSVLSDIVQEDAFRALTRHVNGDWGELEASDKQTNDEALLYGGRLLSSYRDREGVVFWIITEHHRNLTTVLLPSDY